MTIKDTLSKGFKKTVTFLNDNAVTILTTTSLTALGALLVVSNRQSQAINILFENAEETKRVINHNVATSRYEASHPWHFEDNDPAKARRVELTDEVVQANWPEDD